MKNVLGLRLDCAAERLQADGKPVRLIEVRSKKGGKGTDPRVIKTVETDTETIVYWSSFKTDVTV